MPSVRKYDISLKAS